MPATADDRDVARAAVEDVGTVDPPTIVSLPVPPVIESLPPLPVKVARAPPAALVPRDGAARDGVVAEPPRSSHCRSRRHRVVARPP